MITRRLPLARTRVLAVDVFAPETGLDSTTVAAGTPVVGEHVAGDRVRLWLDEDHGFTIRRDDVDRIAPIQR